MKRKILKTIAALLLIAALYLFFGYSAELGLNCVKTGTEQCAKELVK